LRARYFSADATNKNARAAAVTVLPFDSVRGKPMRVGIHFVNFSLPGAPRSLGSTLAATARTAEEGGVAVFSLMDHWFQMEIRAPAEEPMLEGYTSLGFLAAHTTTMTLALLVSGVTYRHPGLLAKTVTTLDVLSDGRAQLGVGAAWYEREHRGLGVPFPPLGERFERLEEALQICLQMWSDNNGPYAGTHYQLAETICSPPPINSPRPRILVGGSGERKTLRLVARYADACNLFASSPADIAHKLDVLARHCESEGRDPASIERTILSIANPFDDLDGFLSQMAAYAKVGIDTVELIPVGDPVAFTARVGQRVVPALAQLER
jgi:F420-dependent oxidoreductase-like protein